MKYGLIGHPLGHSFSKDYFTKKFEREGLDCEYNNYDLEDLSMVRQLKLSGFNVTIPYKEAIIPYLDELDPVAAEVGAVNTVKVLPDGRLKGFNTDVIGLEASLSLIPHPALRIPNSEFRIPNSEFRIPPSLLLGTGGASKAVQYVLRKHRIPFHLVSRDPEKGDFTYQDLSPEVIKTHLLIINATPVGMFPNVEEAPSLPYEALSPDHVLLDLIYNPEETLFLRHGREHGATILNGLTMLHAQADATWEIFIKN
jgi:shikimate dehydrogenase